MKKILYRNLINENLNVEMFVNESQSDEIPEVGHEDPVDSYETSEPGNEEAGTVEPLDGKEVPDPNPVITQDGQIKDETEVSEAKKGNDHIGQAL